MNDFARRLKECREKKKLKNSRWTQRYVAEKIGMARTTYTAYENGTKTPQPDTINNLAILLDVSNDYLMGRTNEIHAIPKETWDNYVFLPVISTLSLDKDTSLPPPIAYMPTDKELLDESATYIWLEINVDSMINVGIRQGSRVLVRLQEEVENGDIAAVCVKDAQVTLKKVYFNHDQMSLVSENPSIEDQVLSKNEVEIKGKAIYFSTLL